MVENMNTYFQEKLFEDRDKKMASKVIKFLKENPGESFFFAFGAGHFIGDNSVLHHMKAAGYR